MINGNLNHIEAIFIGASAGGVVALNKLFDMLPEGFRVPIIVVIHLGEKPFIPSAFHAPKGVRLCEAEEKESIIESSIYFAPPNYHLLIEDDLTFSLTNEEKVQFARPSLDVTMDSLARVYRSKLLGIILTGANEDGADGLHQIKKFGGLTIVQDPEEAYHKSMPMAAIKKAKPDYILPLTDIGEFLIKHFDRQTLNEGIVL